MKKSEHIEKKKFFSFGKSVDVTQSIVENCSSFN